MSWLDQLAAELSVRGVAGRAHRRIVLELADHIECDPGCEERLGDPRELASSFADELATDQARRSAFYVFGALAATATALAVSQLSIRAAGGHRGITAALSPALFFPALVGMVIAPQVALVAGTLAAARAVRRRRARAIPAAEIGLIRRRAWIALGSGFGVVAGLELYVLDFSTSMPAWWLALVGGLAAVAGVALVAAWRQLARGGALVSGVGGRAGDIYDDLPLLDWSWLRRHPWQLGLLASLAVGLGMALFEAHAERSLFEGLQRGTVEALAALLGFALLGRAIGLPPGGTANPLVGATLGSAPAGRLVADADRARAELILREGFARGRLSLDELSSRLTLIHGAVTIDELRAALSGLPDDL